MLRRSRTLKSGKVWVSYYYNGRGLEGERKEIPLGRDLNEAKIRWAELERAAIPAGADLMRFVFDRYEREIVPTKAPRTQRDNLDGLRQLRKVFEDVSIDIITPQHIAMYRDRRGKKAPVRANREIALFSHVWNVAREWGFTQKENPVRGVRKNKETPRDYYADDHVWKAVYEVACEELKDAMDLAYLTGQRPADVLKMSFADIKDNALWVRQNKTTKKLRVLLEDNGVQTGLGKVIDRIKARGRKVRSLSLLATPYGLALNKGTLRSRWDDARAMAAEIAEEGGQAELAASIRAFQFRDIRPKAASETDLTHASKLLGHTDKQITETVYRRIGEVVMPTK